jgi:hypothetical protein
MKWFTVASDHRLLREADGAQKRRNRRYFSDEDQERARRDLASYLRRHGLSPTTEAMGQLLLRLERHERIVSEGEQALIRLAREE